MRRVAIAVIVFSLTGCLSSDTSRGPANPDADSPAGNAAGTQNLTAFEFGHSWVGNATNSQREAFIAINPGGDEILICGHGYFQQPANLWYSDNGGDAFTAVALPVNAGVSGDCEVEMQDGTWTLLHSTVAGATVTVSRNQGATWTVNHLAALPINGLADRPWMSYAGATLVLTWMPLGVQPGTIGIATSLDQGETWSTPAWLLPPDPNHPDVKQGDIIVSPEGLWRIPLQRNIPSTQLSFAVSEDEGASWVEIPVPFTTTGTSPVGPTVDGAGRIYWPYASPDGLRLAFSDDGAAWNETILLGPGLEWPRPWGAGRSDGGAVFIWESNGQEIGRDATTILAARVDSSLNITYTALLEGPLIEFAQVRLDAADRAHVAIAWSANPQRGVPNPTAQSTSSFHYLRQVS